MVSSRLTILLSPKASGLQYFCLNQSRDLDFLFLHMFVSSKEKSSLSKITGYFQLDHLPWPSVLAMDASDARELRDLIN